MTEVNLNAEVSLLQAVSELYAHKVKKKILQFKIIFGDTEKREIIIGKSYSKVQGKWQYYIKERNLPAFAYSEYNFLANISRIKGIGVCFNTVEYIVQRQEGE